MKIPVIKKLVQNYELDQLTDAEEAIASGKDAPIDIEGEDEGEKLTHAFAAKFIKQQMEKEDKDFRSALRAYTQKVRDSID